MQKNDPKNPTLRTIANQLGISTTTVHRALYGKGRVSEKTCEKVLEVAKSIGYKSNYMAASLKRKATTIAIVFPEPTLENRYYYLNLWHGIKQFTQSVSEFNIKFQEFSYPLSSESNGLVLKDIYENHLENLSGIVTIAVNNSLSTYFIEQFYRKNIPVVLIGSDLCKDYTLCTVKSYNEIAGSMAAELLTIFKPKDIKQNIIVTGNLVGNLTMIDQYENLRGFENYIQKNAPNIKILQACNSDTSIAYKKIKEILNTYDNIYAIYSCSARHTIQMCNAVIDLGLENKIKLIGNDYFSQSADLLRNNILTAIIDKKIAKQSYTAIRVLFNYIIKSEYPPSSILYTKPSIILKSNLET